MGMFDYIQCDRLAPGEPEAFQTKELDCDLDMVKITSDGRLVVTSRQKWFAATKENTYVDVYEDLNYTGKIEFCGDAAGTFGEYYAQFLDGQLIGIWKLRTFSELYTYYSWEREQEYKAEWARRKALPIEEQERLRKEAADKLGESISSYIFATANRTGFIRKFLNKSN
jgi:hypothetical protein